MKGQQTTTNGNTSDVNAIFGQALATIPQTSIYDSQAAALKQAQINAINAQTAAINAQTALTMAQLKPYLEEQARQRRAAFDGF